MKKTAGIHHITAIVGHPQENLDFYAEVLGLRFVKKTVNFDDPGTYHFYFGDDKGNPGTIITFFPWLGGKKGVIGDGQVGVTSYAVPQGALAFWEKRLTSYDINVKRSARFGETYLSFHDPHGLALELVERRSGTETNWHPNGITKDVAIKGFAGATLYSTQPDKTIQFLKDVLGLKEVGTEKTIARLTTDAAIGNVTDVKLSTNNLGESGVGTVHHIAWRADDEADQLEWRNIVKDEQIPVTSVRDRNYFTSIYFKEYGDILFEIATDSPGFLVDEPYESLGTDLKLPKQYEKDRVAFEKILLPIQNNFQGGD